MFLGCVIKLIRLIHQLKFQLVDLTVKFQLVFRHRIFRCEKFSSQTQTTAAPSPTFHRNYQRVCVCENELKRVKQRGVNFMQVDVKHTCENFSVFIKFPNRESHLIICRLPSFVVQSSWLEFLSFFISRPPRFRKKILHAKIKTTWRRTFPDAFNFVFLS